MTIFRRLALSALMALSLTAGALSFEAHPALAQDTGLEAVGAEINLSAEDPRIIAARIINVVLGLLGIIVLVIVLYAGFQWMTSGGDAAKVDEAKTRLRNAVIGLVIILSAYALTSFVINALTEATGFGEGTGVSGPGGPGGPLPPGGGPTAFQLRSIMPSGSITLRNVEVSFIFSRDVDPATATPAIQVLLASDSTAVAGTVSVDGSTVTFVPSEPCPAPNEDRRCFDRDTEYIARVATSLRSSAGTALVCGGFAPTCEGRFTTGSLVDTADPTAVIEYPLDGQGVPVDDLILVRTRATDDSGISRVRTFVDESLIGTGTGADSSSPFVTDVEWDTSGLSTGGRSLMSRAFDLDSNTADSPSVGVVIRPRHCFNGVQDEDETAVDCGGAACGACSGGSCTSGATCASGFCAGGVCVEQPVITLITPDDGRPGTLVSISGANFGTTPGAVIFSPRIAASAPAACAAAGVPTWTPTLVVVEVPEGAADGPIELENASGLIDTTNDERGPILDDFDVNDVARPGLCAVRPASGVAGDAIELVGVGLGASSGRVQFNGREVSSFTRWADDLVALNAPVFSPATYAVLAIVGDVESNAVAFRLNERVVTAAPIIDAIDPAAGPVGEYITLQGRNFGGRIGTVWFRRGDGSGRADTRFPEQCSVAFWTDTAVTVKVPPTYGAGLGDAPVMPGDWQVVVERQDTVESNAFGFTVNDEVPRPGICAVRPGAGPVDTNVEIIGERFGYVRDGRATFSGPSGPVSMSVAGADWSDGRIVGDVPTGAVTGQVRVSQIDVSSNGVPFTVRNCNEDASICSVGEVCCRSGACSIDGVCEASSPEAEFAWQLSTGILPVNPRVVEECSPDRPASPSPWAGRSGGDNVCVNTDLFIRFTTPLDRDTVPASLLVRECIGPADNPCSDASDPIPPAPGTGLLIGTEGPADTGNGYIRFRPAALWDGNSVYQVILTTGIESNTNIPMLENASRCGAGNAYCFTFGTRDAADVCRVGTINVVPESATLTDLGETRDEIAVPRAEGDICLNLRADAYDWTWEAPDSRVEISNNEETLSDGSLRGLEAQIATARGETGSESVPVIASIIQEGETIAGLGRVFVRLQPPRVVAFGPNCDEACLNAAAWARFNTAIEESTVTGNVILRQCVNENCLSYTSTIDMSSADIRVTSAPDTTSEARTYLIVEPIGAGGTTLLEVGRFYRITLRGGDLTGIRSTNGLPLAGLNDPEGFTWTFRVREGDDARCATARVEVLPAEKYETTVGARQSFAATPISGPNACDADGSPLIGDRTYAWTVDQPAPISRFVNGGTGSVVGLGTIDTTRVLPAGCSGRCLNLGSDGVFGQTASCGNGRVETTNARYCVGGLTPFGTACTLLPPGSRGGEECDDATSLCGVDCRWRPMTGSTCGNGVVNRGEQCDEGPDGGRGCSAQCQLLGSRAGVSTCGNSDVAAGEACDDGNTRNGDGCSADCLHEGSIRVRALCGNGLPLEPGESCERPAPGAPFPAGCNTTTCLNEGTTPPTCGNTTVDAGEDCDDGNLVSGDGCSARCLLEGSSAAYPVPAFCGDGVRHRSEQCESLGGDSRQDALQLAQIVGEGEPDGDGRMSSQIVAEYDAQRGQSTYGLQCGFSEESSCPAGTGLDTRGCCALRPTLVGQYPTAGETGVCRNAMISATFNLPMDTGSLQANFVLAEEVTDAVCPDGTQLLVSIEDYDPTPGFRGWINRTWQRMMSWFRAPSAEAAWCVGSARGRLNFEPSGAGTKANFVLENALKADTTYQVLFRGDTNLADNGDVNNRVGIRSTRGVIADGNILWSFTTGLRLCTVTAIHVRDTDPDSPNLFTSAEESHLYTADVISLQDGRRIALSPVTEYTWTWQPWIASNRDVLEAEIGVGSEAASESNVTVVTPPQNGSSFIEAGIRIVRDEVSVVSTTGRIVKGTQNATVLLCEVPWPERSLAPFSETSGHDSLVLLGRSPLAREIIRATVPYFNFATMYCRDAGAPGTEGDLPPMNVQPVVVSEGDREIGILRQYLFTFDVPALRGDGIGIRVASNPLHLAPSAWYASRGFTGSPEAITVDGYEAVKDGTTWYVGAVNTDAASGAPVYSQIYILSHNPDAKPETLNIVGQMVETFTLNANIQSGASNACSYAIADGEHVPGEFYRGTDGQLVRCTADWECLDQNPNLLCASFKAKMQRDSKRIVDFQFMTDALEEANTRSGNYPQLQAGTFVPTLSTSRWPSWSSQLQGEIGVSFPTDPVNRFLSCGFCTGPGSGSGSPCQDSTECSAGQTCTAAPGRDGLEPSTCWNPNVRQYQCPSLTVGVRESASRIYQYRAINAGDRYELATELEGALANRYVPPLLTQIRRCSNLDSPCATDENCDVTNAAGAVISSGTCNATGGTWRYHGVCEASSVYGPGGEICGDGVVGRLELCEFGDTRPEACTIPVPDDPATPAREDLATDNGTKLQICNDCGRDSDTAWIDGPDTRCVVNVQCGNGRVDAGETCDDGALNGSYGRCNRTCSGYDAFCGDAGRSPGESCDLGADNGRYCRSDCNASTSCSLSCTGPGPRCGDSIVNGPELCDGNAERTTSAICVGGFNANNTCSTGDDCPGGSCPAGIWSPAVPGVDPGNPNGTCDGVTVRRCSNDHTRSCTADTECGEGFRCLSYPTSRVRTCKAYGGTDPAPEWCTWNTWTGCAPTSYCGDGIVDEGESCDDGNRSNNDACTNACRPNVCGDSFYYIGVEECDQGSANGTRSCTADYGSTCLSCSTSCRQVASSGGFCGNGVREGSEQCDGTQGLGSCSGDSSRSCLVNSDCTSGETCNLISCRTLGFDYVATKVCRHYEYYTTPTGDVYVVTGPLGDHRRRPDGTLDPAVPGEDSRSDTIGRFHFQGNVDPLAGWVRHRGSWAAAAIPSEHATVCLPSSPPRDGLSCASSCGYAGCLRCGERPGTGEISAQVFDAVYFNQPVPNARVSLYNRGVLIDQTHTDGDGRFTFEQLDENGACVNYRIIVDFYQDNPCTGDRPEDAPTCDEAPVTVVQDVDESVYGGYWPYESRMFSVSTFHGEGLRNSQGKLFLAPRVGPGETLAIHTWNGRTPGYIDAHLVFPPSYEYRHTGPGPTNLMGDDTYEDCEITEDCTREIRWSFAEPGGTQGNYDLNMDPHASLYCINTEAPADGCSGFVYAPQVVKWKRDPEWANTGKYSLYLVNFDNQGYLSYSNSLANVRIITEDRIYAVDAPNTVSCTHADSGQVGKFWLVFQQDASSGAITFPSAATALQCTGQPADTGHGTNLPQPMADTTI